MYYYGLGATTDSGDAPLFKEGVDFKIVSGVAKPMHLSALGVFRSLQKAVGVKDDGDIGNQTATAVQSKLSFLQKLSLIAVSGGTGVAAIAKAAPRLAIELGGPSPTALSQPTAQNVPPAISPVVLDQQRQEQSGIMDRIPFWAIPAALGVGAVIVIKKMKKAK